MGLIGNFFGLLFSGGYTAKTLLSERATNQEYDRRREAFRQSFHDVNTLLTDNELDKLVGEFISQGINKEAICKILSEDISYITSGDDSIVLSSQQTKDLIMSKFGKVSNLTRAGCTRFGNFVKVGKTLSSYDVSILVMQCVESNIKNATGKSVMFGAAHNSNCYNGKYPSAKIEAFGTSMNSTIRIYNAVSIPYVAIRKEELLK